MAITDLHTPHNDSERNALLGIVLMIFTILLFAIQDGIIRAAVAQYDILPFAVMRYWVAFLLTLLLIGAHAKRQSMRKNHNPQLQRLTFIDIVKTAHPVLQITRGLLLALEVCIMIWSFKVLGLVETHAIFMSYPLLITLLSHFILSEKLKWRRLTAIGIGFFGVMVILNPGPHIIDGMFDQYAVLPLIGAFLFALYAILTRFAARFDTPMTSFFWMSIVGTCVMTLFAPWIWQTPPLMVVLWVVLSGVLASISHWLLIKCYALVETGVLQPFCYLHFVFSATIGIVVFGESLTHNIVVGSVIVVASGLFTLWRTHYVQKQQGVQP